MFVPVAPAERPPRPRFPGAPDPSVGKLSRYQPATDCSVLIVEDDEDLREMMAQLVTLEGFQARAVANGREALKFLKANDPPQLILLDMMMPVMDGWEFRREQQRDATLSGVPVVVLSALDESRIGNIGAAAYLKKPLDFDRLIDLVRRHCESR